MTNPLLRRASARASLLTLALLACMQPTCAGEPAGSSGAPARRGSASPGAEPRWVPLAHPPLGCPVERVENAREVRAFSWAPCEGAERCERMVPDRAFAEAAPLPSGTVQEEGGSTLVILSLSDAHAYHLLFTDGEGALIEGYRLGRGRDHCLLGGGDASGERLGAVVLIADPRPGKVRVGGVAATRDGAAPRTFEISPTPSGYGPGAHAMAGDRWLWRYSPDKLVAVSAAGEAGALTLAGPVDQGPLLALSRPVSTGAGFLFGEVEQPAGGAPRGLIASSDGRSPPRPYLVPSDDSFYDAPAFAGSHVAWFRGKGFRGPNQYESVEIWAAPYHADPAQLAPYKVDDYPAQSLSDSVGGHGRFAALSTRDAPVFGETFLWNLSTRERSTVTLPGRRRLAAYLGLTSTHLWALGSPVDDRARPDLAVRFAID